MKEFSKNQLRVLSTVFAAALIVSAVLSIVLIHTWRTGIRAKKSEQLLRQSEYDHALAQLMESLDENDIYRSYHYARSASEKAAMIGENEISRMLSSSAERIISGDQAEGSVTDAVKTEISEFFTNSLEEQTESDDDYIQEDSAVNLYRTEAAEICVSRLFGEHNPLTAERKSADGNIVYTCKNAYAVIDLRSGVPREAVISLEKAEKRLGEKECEQYALGFIGDFFMDEISSSAEIVSVTADDYSGTFIFEIQCHDKNITAAVRRDSGRIARFSIG